MNRKRVLLAALLVILALSILYAMLAMPRLEKAPVEKAHRQPRPTTAASGETAAGRGPDRLDLAALSREPQPFAGAKRDIFNFVQPKPQRQPAPPPVVKAPPPQVQPAPRPTPALVRQELATFTYLGFLERAGVTTVFLTSDKELYLVKKGDSFGSKGQFTVEDISGNQLQVRRDGNNDLMKIPLIEQQKLQAAFSAPARLPPTPPLPEAPESAPRSRPVRPAQMQNNGALPPEQFTEGVPDRPTDPAAPGETYPLEGDVNGTNQ